ncbi:hypothetical protein BRPE64_ACDS22220 [Caballeronia insecticola]|uniref:Uncharacterized protein n=1 Tax=Caballeronia insecticola TaxID=758793 RepID=R4WXW4_9BURK|nr:hypothetical protein BRPE64_ACDS22220 [Caballeronia insecticola]
MLSERTRRAPPETQTGFGANAEARSEYVEKRPSGKPMPAARRHARAAARAAI